MFSVCGSPEQLTEQLHETQSWITQLLSRWGQLTVTERSLEQLKKSEARRFDLAMLLPASGQFIEVGSHGIFLGIIR